MVDSERLRRYAPEEVVEAVIRSYVRHLEKWMAEAEETHDLNPHEIVDDESDGTLQGGTGERQDDDQGEHRARFRGCFGPAG